MNELKWLREHHRITVPEIADELGLQADEYQMFENGTGASRLDRLNADYKKLIVSGACKVIVEARRYG